MYMAPVSCWWSSRAAAWEPGAARRAINMPVTAAPADVYVHLTEVAARTGQDVRAVALAWVHAKAGSR